MVNKNQLAGKRGGTALNEKYNGGIDGCLRKFNAANCGAHWRTKNLGTCQRRWLSKHGSGDGIKSKRRGY